MFLAWTAGAEMAIAKVLTVRMVKVRTAPLVTTERAMVFLRREARGRVFFPPLPVSTARPCSTYSLPSKCALRAWSLAVTSLVVVVGVVEVVAS